MPTLTSSVLVQLQTYHLGRTWSFYSALGMHWDPSSEEEPPEDQTPYESTQGLPDLEGNLGNLCFQFFWTAQPPTSNPSVQMAIKYSTVDELAWVFAALGVNRPTASHTVEIVDPDHRQLLLYV
jgi:hypothetical protein